MVSNGKKRKIDVYLIMNPKEYVIFATELHKLIISEMNKIYSDEDLPQMYPKFVTMYEFFRLVRGESFMNSRPPIGDSQKDLYRMEDEIAQKLDEIKLKINPDDGKTKYYIDQAKKDFDVIK